MSNAIKGVKVGNEVKKIDYNSLDNLPTLVSVDATLTESGEAADAGIVGDWFAKRGFKLIGDTTITEAKHSVIFSNDLDGNLTSKYDDFFLLAFIVPVNSDSCTLAVRTDSGLNYQAWLECTPTAGKTYVWWHLSETIGSVGQRIVRRSLYPNKLLTPAINDNTVQGSGDAISSIDSDISLTAATTEDYNIFFHNVTNQFDAGTRVVLFGRTRQP